MATESTPLKSLTVRELRELLNDEDDDAVVVFSSNYGDYHRTEQVHAIRGRFEEAVIEPTAYSVSGWCVAGSLADDDADEKYDDLPHVLIIS